jgi:disulfide bond formation protein DsbB
MKRLPPLPRRFELSVFALVAVACAGLAAIVHAHDLAMAIFALPIFVFAAWMGMRRSGQWASISVRVTEETAPAMSEELEEEEVPV